MKKTFRFVIIVYILITIGLLLPLDSIQFLRKNILVWLIFPTEYKMFTNPPDSKIIAEYTYYSKGKVLEKIESDSLFKHRIKNQNLFYPYHRTQYAMYFYDKSSFENDYNHWFYEKTNSNEDLNQEDFIIALNSESRKYFHNLIGYAHQYQKEHLLKHSIDSVKVEIIHQPVELPDDHNFKNRFSAFVGKRMIYTKTIPTDFKAK